MNTTTGKEQRYAPSSRGKTVADALFHFGVGPISKTCTTCRQILPATSDHFTTCRAVKLGIGSKCRKCTNIDRNRLRRLRPEAHQAASRAAYQLRKLTDPQSIRDYHNARNGRIRLEVLNHYSGGALICKCCGVQENEFLCIDHIEGGGRRHRQQITTNIYDWLRRNDYPDGFRVLCYNCNMSRGLYGFCPHSGANITQKEKTQ